MLSGYYINENDLLPYIDSTELNSITTVIDSSSGLTNVQQAIINRCSYVDSQLSDRYETPFDLNDATQAKYVTNALKQAIASMVLYDLLINYQSASEEVAKVREMNYKNAIQFLTDIRNGKLSLITELDDLGEKVDRYYFKSTKRIDESFH